MLRTLDRAQPIDKTTLAARATLLVPSLLRILKDLEEIDLVRLVASSRNPRLSRVLLSAKGGVVVEQTSAAIASASGVVKARIGHDHVERLLELLHHVEVRLVGLEIGPPPGA